MFSEGKQRNYILYNGLTFMRWMWWKLVCAGYAHVLNENCVFNMILWIIKENLRKFN